MAAIFKAIVASLLICALILNTAHADAARVDCGAACVARCRLASRQKMCLRACGTCCLRCQCVPPGTSGNQDVCPCYATMTTHDGSPKCP